MMLWHMTERKVPNGHTQPVTCAIYNPTFELVVSADESSLVRVWDLSTGRAILRFSDAHTNANGEPVKVSALMFDRTQRRLVSGAHNGTVKVWNFSTGQCLEELSGFGEGEVTSMAPMHISPYEYFVASGWNHKVTFWLDSQAAGNPRPAPGSNSQHTSADFHMEGHKDDILCMSCRNEGQLLVTGSFDGDVVIWNTESGHVRTRLILPGLLAMRGDQKPIEAMELLVCPVQDNPLPLHRLSSEGFGMSMSRHAQIGDPDVVLVLTAGGDGVMRFWSTNSTAELLLEFEVTESTEIGLSSLSLCHRNKVLVAADGQGWLVVYDVTATMRSAPDSLHPKSKPLLPPVKQARFRAHATPISCLQYISARRLILTGSQDCTLCLWTLEGKKLGTFGEPSEWKLDRSSFRFEKQLDESVFNSAEDEEEREEMKQSMREKRFGEKKLNISERLRGGKGVSPLMTSGSFFMTQPSEPVNPEKSAEVSEEISEEELDAVPSFTGSGSEDEDSASEVEDAEEILGLGVGAAEPKESLLLRMDINEIVNKGLAMRERGEKFFEAGNREVPAYQRMIVRDLAPYTLPEKIAKRLKGGRVKPKVADSREVTQSIEGLGELAALYSLDPAPTRTVSVMQP